MNRRHLAGPAAVVIVLALAACSSDDADSPGDAPEASAGAVWAGDVCSAMTDLEASLQDLGQGLDVSLGSGDAVDQLKTQVGEQADAVEGDLEALASAVSDVPDDADADVTDAAADLDAQRADLKTSVEAVESAAAAVADADSAPALATAISAATTAVKTASDDFTAYVSSLETAATTGADSVQAAFDDAPECAAYVSS
jgi:hypothetical protein